MTEVPFPIGAKVRTVGYADPYIVTGYWRGDVKLRNKKTGTEYHAPVSHVALLERRPSVAKTDEKSWKELPKRKLAAFLYDNKTIADISWTKEIRKPGEKRDEFIKRVLGVKRAA